MLMKFISVQTLMLLPLLSFAPAVLAATVPTPESGTGLEVAQMIPTYCAIASATGGVDVYDAPDGEVFGGIPEGDTVSLNMGGSDAWAEVTGSDGTTGWVEAQYLACDDASASAEDADSESYSEGYSESYSEEEDAAYVEEAPVYDESETAYSEEPVADQLVEETAYEESYDETAVE